MGIFFLEKKKQYRVSYSKRHPKTREPVNMTRTTYVDDNGIRRHISTKAQANRIHRQLILEVEAKINRQLIPKWGQLLEKFEPYYLESGVTEKTVETYLLCLRKHTTDWLSMGIEDITDLMIRDLVKSSEEIYSKSHSKNLLKFIRRVFQFAVESGFLNRNPTPQIKFKIGQQNLKVLKESEIERLLRSAKENSCEWYPHWALALFTGMRSGELFALRWDDVDFEAEHIQVRRSWNSKDGFKTTKSGDERLVPIAPTLVHLLKELRMSRHHPEFVLPRLEKWAKGEQARCLRMYLMGLGLPVVRFHDLRASWATLLLGKGVEPVKVMAMGGWKDMKTMMIYTRKAGLDLQGATSCLQFHDPKESVGKLLKFGAE